MGDGGPPDPGLDLDRAGGGNSPLGDSALALGVSAVALSGGCGQGSRSALCAATDDADNPTACSISCLGELGVRVLRIDR